MVEDQIARHAPEDVQHFARRLGAGPRRNTVKPVHSEEMWLLESPAGMLSPK